jgi:hypothetical protein
VVAVSFSLWNHTKGGVCLSNSDLIPSQIMEREAEHGGTLL